MPFARNALHKDFGGAIMSVKSTRVFFVCWISGLAAGALFAVGADPSLLSLVRRAASCRVSTVVLLLTAIFPFLITAYAVYINRFSLLFLVAVLKSFTFSFLAGVIFRSFGSAGWLIQPMLQFSDTVLCSLYCWFCIRSCRDPGKWKRDLIICVIFAAVTVIVDSLLVSAFLRTLV